MATATERNQVTKLIRFSPVASKRAKGNDVMDVKSVSKLSFGYATLLAGVVIALASLVALPMPIWATVLPVSALPVGLVLLNTVLVVAIGRAVEVFVSTILGSVPFGRFATVGAGKCNRPFWVATTSRGASGIVAFRRAESFAISMLAVIVLLAALLARPDFRGGAAMSHALGIFQSALVGAVLAWWMLATETKQLRGIDPKLFAAGPAGNEKGHENILPTKDCRLLSEWGRSTVGRRLFRAVHDAVLSPCGIVPRAG